MPWATAGGGDGQRCPSACPAAPCNEEAARKSGHGQELSGCKGAYPPRLGIPDELVWLCPGRPSPRGDHGGGWLPGWCGAPGREAGREQWLARATEAEQPQPVMPAHLSNAPGAGEHEGGQSPLVLAHQPRRGLGTAGMWDLAPTPQWAQPPPPCNVGERHQEPSVWVFFPHAQAQPHEGTQASGAERAGRPLDRASQKRERGCSLSHRLPQSFLPSPQGPIPHPHSMPHALSLSGRRAHLPDTHTCTHCLPHHDVCVWALGCHGFTSRQLAGSQEDGKQGGGRVRPTSAPPPSRSCTPPSLPPCNASFQDSQSRGLGSSQRQDVGLQPWAGLCNSHLQQRCCWSGSRTQPEPGSGEEQPGLASISPACAETPQGDRSVGTVQQLPPPGEGLVGLVQWWSALEVHAVAPRRALGLAPKPPPWSWQLALPLSLVCLSGRVLRPLVGSCV